MFAPRNFYVPWPDLSEWETVREQIFSSDISNLIRAYETILMWKLKYNSIPAYIESTYTLLQVMVKEYQMTKNDSESLLHNDVSSYRGETLYLAAKTQNIPDWIINMRHDAAHSQELPTLNALHIAADLALKWLLDNYWSNAEHFDEKPMDVSERDIEKEHFNEMNSDTQNFFKKLFEIWEVCFDSIKIISFIAEMENEFMLHVEELLTLHGIYFQDVENDAVDKIQRIVLMYHHIDESGSYEAEIMTKIRDFQILLLKCLRTVLKSNEHLKESVVMSLIQTTFLLETHFNPEKWREVLCLLQELNIFSLLLQVLLQMAGKGHNGATKWLSTLPPSLKLLRKQWAMFKVLKKENNNFKTKLLKHKVQKKVKAGHNLQIKLLIFKPPVISLEMMKSVLLNPEQFNVKDIVEFLKLVRPPLMKPTIHMIKDLLTLQTVRESQKPRTEQPVDKIFTVEDLYNVMNQRENKPVEEAKNVKGWIKTSIDAHSWNKCPLGLLPFQSKVNCSLPETLTWKKKCSNTRRQSIPLMQHSMNMKRNKIE